MKEVLIILLIGLTACAANMKGSKKDIRIEEALINGYDIVIKNKTIKEAIDLTELLHKIPINDKSSFVQVTSNIYFQDCIFEGSFKTSKRTKEWGEVATQFINNVAFINCKFLDQAEFRASVFKGHVDFSNSTFKKGANFQDALFTQKTTFNGTFWEGEGKFQLGRFYHTTTFMDARATEHMMFQGAVFHDECNFNISDFQKYVDFSLVRFNGKSSFNYTKWKDRAVFTNCVWRDHTSFVHVEFGDISFKGSRCDGNFLMEGENITGEYTAMEMD